MMTNYYFLMTLFTPLRLGEPLPLGFKELMSLLKLNLTQQDQEKVKLLFLPIELYNVKAFLMGMPLDDRGSFQGKELEEELLVQQDLPTYLIDYLQKYEKTEDRLHHFSSLYVSMYQDLVSSTTGFLKKYFSFERELHLILTALRSLSFGKDLTHELQFEDPKEPFIAELLAQKDRNDLIPPAEYEEVKSIFLQFQQDPMALNREILNYRFEKLEEMKEPQDFGIDQVLAYVAQYLLAQSIVTLDREKGMEELSRYE